MRFKVLTAASMKMTVFWVVARCSLVEVYRRFRGAYCFHQQGDHHLIMEAVSTSETSVNFYQNKRSNIQEDGHIRILKRVELWVWTGYIWLRIGPSGGLLWTRFRTLGLYKMLGISWLAERLLASQEGLCSMELPHTVLTLKVRPA
jgi:hypothetical protein